MAKKRPTDAKLRTLDEQILELINQRAAAALEGEELTSAAARAISDPAVLQRLIDQNDGPLSAAAVQNIFRELLGGIRAAAQHLRVAYLGPEYTYSHLAAIARFGQSAELLPVASIAAVFDEVERGHAEYGVVPIENSTDGRVADALECLARQPGRSEVSVSHPEVRGSTELAEFRKVRSQDASLKPQASLQICGEVPLRIHHCLLGRGSRNQIRRIASKPQALSQCRNWLSAHLPNAKLEPTASTAEAARLAAAEPDTAAIAAEQAAVNHSLTVLARNIEDNPDNVTRFAVIGAKAAERTGRDKTALVFEAPHKPGALADAMAIFKRQKLNLTWIESFPIPAARGRYLFFVEFQGHPDEQRVQRAIAALEKKSLRQSVLGSYAESDVVG
jgi:chorismate mutase/prephenate dehydratase